MLNAACFSLQELDTEADREEESTAAPILTLAPCQCSSNPGRRRREGGWVGGERGVGQTFPWQDPWDTAEARVQPVKERMRTRQSISGSHLHNKWSSHIFSSTCSFIRSLARSLARTPFVSVSTLGSSAHANAGSDGGWREEGEEEGRRAAICWSGTNSMSVSKTPQQVCGVISKCIAAESWTLVASAFKSIPPNNQ